MAAKKSAVVSKISRSGKKTSTAKHARTNSSKIKKAKRLVAANAAEKAAKKSARKAAPKTEITK